LLARPDPLFAEAVFGGALRCTMPSRVFRNPTPLRYVMDAPARGSGPELLGSNHSQGLFRRRIGCEWRRREALERRSGSRQHRPEAIFLLRCS
jgi:hypothetical protein